MSLIGPRPERPEFVVQLRKAFPLYEERLAVLPGLTGLAQVQLPPDTTLESVRRKLQYDLHYASRVSLVLDLKILVSTVFHLAAISFDQTRRLALLPTWESVSTTDLSIPETTDRSEPTAPPQPA